MPSVRTLPVVAGQPSLPSGNWVEVTPGGLLGRLGSNTKRHPGAPCVGFQSENKEPSFACAFQEKLPFDMAMWGSTWSWQP